MPRPLQSPRTKPLETMGRSSGMDNRSGLSVHLGVQGRMISNTPNVAHVVTNRRARSRNNHMRTADLEVALAMREGWASGGVDDSSGSGIEGTVFGSAVTQHSGLAAGESVRLTSIPSGYFTASGL